MWTLPPSKKFGGATDKHDRIERKAFIINF